jgi:peroxiredoxin Q/BCP
MKTSLLIALAFLVSFTLAHADPAKMPAVGDKAPLVKGVDQDGKAWKLSDSIGKKAVLLYFYPKDNTPGCTKEACGLRDRMSDLKKDNVEVIGVSFDSSASHRQFISDYTLNFPLVADTDGKIADAYGVRVLGKNMAHRVSFLIGKDGKIIHITDNPKAEIHLSEMKEAIENLPQK